MSLLGQCLTNYGLGDTNINEKNDNNDVRDVNACISDCYLYGLVYSNAVLDFSSFTNKVNGLIALIMNREEEEEVIMAMIREELENNVCNELILSTFIVETFNKAILPTDLFINILNGIPSQETMGLIDCRATTAFVFYSSPSYISSKDKDLTETIINLLSQSKKK